MNQTGVPKGASFDEDAVRRALSSADTNVLRVALYQATGDSELGGMKTIRQSFWAGAYEVVVLDPQCDEVVRDKALAFLKAGGGSRCELPDDAALRTMMEMLTGGPVSDFIFNFGKEELNFSPLPRGVKWSESAIPAGTQDFHVSIIGAGASGLVAGVHLKRLGIPFTIIERNAEVGGTWLVNDYPGARVDIASHHYQLTVTQKYPWKHWYATQQELLDYLREVADTHALRPHIQFNAEVRDARWNETTKRWDLTLAGADGSIHSTSSNVVISAAGLFNEPNIPDIPGIGNFSGRMFHTTQWDHTYDYAGKRVGIIGVGCTGAQLMPELARTAEHVSVFQRSPHWVSKMEGYREQIPQDVSWLLQSVPHYWNWQCFKTFHTLYEDDGEIFHLDRNWQAQGGQINRKNDTLRSNLQAAIRAEFPEAPDFAERLMPKWPPFAKRLVVDNGWFEALKKPHVELISQGIARITESGVTTLDGCEHELDLLVLAGGFKAERFLWPVTYTGRNGTTLEEAWEADGARAYLGMTMPDFPNLFVVYGPNMNPRAGGLFAWMEIWARYAVEAIARMIENGRQSMECRLEAFNAYNQRIDEAQAGCIWGIEDAKSYYISENGRQVINNPLRPSEAYRLTRRVDLADYRID